MALFDEANEIEFFNNCIDQLAKELFYDDNDLRKGLVRFPTDTEMRKAAWIASVLANSSEDEHRRKALSFAILAYLKYQDDEREPLYERYLYVILSRIGNLPAVGSFVHEDEQQEFEQTLISSFDSILSLEMGTNRERYQLNGDQYISGFQSDILQALSEGYDVAVSGPTSSGKSFILQEYIDQNIDQEGSFEVIYVVPTRALISEVSTKLEERHEDATVKTGAYFDEQEEEDNILLVVTPERCLRLLREEMKENIEPALLFFDEFQNVEDGERGVLYEDIIDSLREMWPETQVVVAGPYLDDPGEKLERITGGEVREITTVFTPILQLKVILRFQNLGNKKPRMIDCTIISPTGNDVSFDIQEPDGMMYSDFGNSRKAFLRRAIDEFGEGDRNLIYASQKGWAEECAEELTKGSDEIAPSDQTIDLIDFLGRTIHEDYSLISCLEHGVAFHHGMVPKIARTEIEDIYGQEQDIHTIISTPTLLQGVNLPAENIFIHNPSKGYDPLTKFDFSNLIGRVGRLNKKLHGTIFCIEREDEEWSQDKLEETGNKEIEPATEKALQQDVEDFVTVVDTEDIDEVEEDHLRYTGILVRNKFLKEGDDLRDYLTKKDVSQDKIEDIHSKLEERLKDIEIPERILRRNPTIDPLQQDRLYKAVQQQPEDWIIGGHRTEYSYNRFKEVTEKLDGIFHFFDGLQSEPGYTPTQGQIVYTAHQWLTGDSYKDMIEGRQESDKIPEDEDDVDLSIRRVLQIVQENVRFSLVKHYRILTDILEETDSPATEWMLGFDQMLEMGSIDFRKLELMSNGADRTVVMELYIPDDVDDIISYLEQNQHRLRQFHQNHLEEQGILD